MTRWHGTNAETAIAQAVGLRGKLERPRITPIYAEWDKQMKRLPIIRVLLFFELMSNRNLLYSCNKYRLCMGTQTYFDIPVSVEATTNETEKYCPSGARSDYELLIFLKSLLPSGLFLPIFWKTHCSYIYKWILLQQAKDFCFDRIVRLDVVHPVQKAT